MSYNFKINEKPFVSDKAINTGRELLQIAQLQPVENYELLYKINEGGYTPIQLDEKIDLDKVGTESFKAKAYVSAKVSIDDVEYFVDEIFMTPLELLETAGLDKDLCYLIETRADGDDITYKKDPDHKISIVDGSKFYSKKFKKNEVVEVNDKIHPWHKETISYNEVVELAYSPVPFNPQIVYTIFYSRGVASKPEGTMVLGDVIKVKNKMIFNVTQANQG